MTFHLTQFCATVALVKMSLMRVLMRNGIKYHNIRVLSTTPVSFEKLAAKTVPKHDWNRAVSEAEKIVG